MLTSRDAFDNFLPAMFRPLQYLARVPGLLGVVLQGLRVRSLRRLPIAFGLLTKRATPSSVVDGWSRPAQQDRAVRRAAERFLRSIDARCTVEAARGLTAFTKPVVLAWAIEDRVLPPGHARRLAALLPAARIDWIEDSYSIVPEDHPAGWQTSSGPSRLLVGDDDGTSAVLPDNPVSCIGRARRERRSAPRQRSGRVARRTA